MAVIKKILGFVLDVLFPIECIGCRKEGEWVCSECLDKIPVNENEKCFVCGRASIGGKTCFLCQREFCLEAVIQLFDKNYLVGEIIRLTKEQYLKNPLLALIEKSFPSIKNKFDKTNIDPRAWVFVPVPLHPFHQRERGFNQAEVMARSLAGFLNASCLNLVAKRSFRLKQKGLDLFDRAWNVRGSFSCVGDVQGKYVCLVDDFAQSGATLNECGRVLLEAGAAGVWGLYLQKIQI